MRGFKAAEAVPAHYAHGWSHMHTQLHIHKETEVTQVWMAEVKYRRLQKKTCNKENLLR